MATVKITDISGVTAPFNIFVCDTKGDGCELITTVTGTTSSPITITLPTKYEKYPEVGVKLEDNVCQTFRLADGLEVFEVYDCCSGVTRYVTLGSNAQNNTLWRVTICLSDCLDPINNVLYTFCALVQNPFFGTEDYLTFQYDLLPGSTCSTTQYCCPNIPGLSETPTPTPTQTPTITRTPTQTKTQTKTPTKTKTPSVTPTKTKTPTKSATAGVTPSNTKTPTKTPTKSQTPTVTQTPSNDPPSTPDPSCPTKTPSKTPTKTPTNTRTPSVTPSETPTNTPSSSVTRTPSKSPTTTKTASPSKTPTKSQTATPSETPTNTPTRTPSKTPRASVTPSKSPSPTLTKTSSPTPSLTPTLTQLAEFSGNSLCGDGLSVNYGGRGEWFYEIDLGTDIGPVTLNFDAFSRPDWFRIFWDGNLVVDTGFRGSPSFNAQLAAYGYPPISGTGIGSVIFDKTASTPTTVILQVVAPLEGTAWTLTVDCPIESPTPTKTLTPTKTPSKTPSQTPSETPTNTPSPTQTKTPTQTSSPTKSPTQTKSETPTNTPTNTPSKTETKTPTNTKTPTKTPNETPTETPTNTPSRTETKSPTPTRTQTKSPSPTPSETTTNTPTNTPSKTETKTPTNTKTPTKTPGETPTETPTNTPTKTETKSPTPTRTQTKSQTSTTTETASPTPTRTQTKSQTLTPTPTKTIDTTLTPTPTKTPTNTPTNTQTKTPNSSPEPTPTQTSTTTSSSTPTPTNTITQSKTPTNTSTPAKTPDPTLTPTPTITSTGSESADCDITITEVLPEFCLDDCTSIYKTGFWNPSFQQNSDLFIRIFALNTPSLVTYELEIPNNCYVFGQPAYEIAMSDSKIWVIQRVLNVLPAQLVISEINYTKCPFSATPSKIFYYGTIGQERGFAAFKDNGVDKLVVVGNNNFFPNQIWELTPGPIPNGGSAQSTAVLRFSYIGPFSTANNPFGTSDNPCNPNKGTYTFDFVVSDTTPKRLIAILFCSAQRPVEEQKIYLVQYNYYVGNVETMVDITSYFPVTNGIMETADGLFYRDGFYYVISYTGKVIGVEASNPTNISDFGNVVTYFNNPLQYEPPDGASVYTCITQVFPI